jgi:hypothetical protein
VLLGSAPGETLSLQARVFAKAICRDNADVSA